MRYLFGFLCVCALGIVPLVGCSETTGSGGHGGMAGINGGGGYSGYPSLCDGIDCNDQDACTNDRCNYRDGSCEHTPVICDDDNECTDNDCNPFEGCHYPSVADGTSCGEGVASCQAGSCVGTFPCTEAGIRHAIAVGGGPHTFDCGGPTTVVTEAEITIYNEVILDGQGELTVDAGYHGGELTGDEHSVFWVSNDTPFTNDVTAELRGFTVTGGWSRIGGGIGNGGQLTLKNTTVSGNAGEEAGGILSWFGSSLRLENSTVSGNWSWEGVGGVHNIGVLTMMNSSVSNNGGQGVGGVMNRELLTMMNSTVSGNASVEGVGGILNSGSEASVSLTNSTVSGNTGPLCDGIDTEGRWDTGTVTLANSTVLGDSGSICANALRSLKTAGEVDRKNALWAQKSLTNGVTLASPAELGAGGTGGTAGGGGWGGWGGWGGYGGWPGEFTLANSVVQGDCTGDSAINSDGYNIESPGNTCGFDPDGTDQVSVSAEDLKLGPLQDNGGPTMTHSLEAGSVAIDAIPEAECLDADGDPLKADQRGEPRPAGVESKCDVGSVEVQP